jgi:hypothetical protein
MIDMDMGEEGEHRSRLFPDQFPDNTRQVLHLIRKPPGSMKRRALPVSMRYEFDEIASVFLGNG